jgi:glycosyltransferase involved in cell wall biosynthesis
LTEYRKMHILIIPSWYPASPEDLNGCFFREQSLALHRYGHQVSVIDVKLLSLRSWKLFFSGLLGLKVVLDEGLLTHRFCGINWFPSAPKLSRWLWLRQGKRLAERYVEEHGKPDVIHAHAMLFGGVLAKSVAQRLAVPFVVTEHSTMFARNLIDERQYDLVRDVASAAARRLAVSGEFCKLLRLKLNNALVWEEIPNIVAQKFIDAPLSDDGVNMEPFVYLNVAVLTEKKGVHNLVSAFAEAFGNNPQVILKIGGDGVERVRLMNLAKELGIAERVIFLGSLTRDQVLAEMAAAHAFVLSSHYETFGVVLVEALALGKPVIATRCGGPESIVRNRDGLLVPPNNVRALKKAMENLRDNYSNYNKVEIRAECISRFSEMVIAERLSSIYLEVLA